MKQLSSYLADLTISAFGRSYATVNGDWRLAKCVRRGDADMARPFVGCDAKSSRSLTRNAWKNSKYGVKSSELERSVYSVCEEYSGNCALERAMGAIQLSWRGVRCFIPFKRCEDGKRFGFVRFSNISDAHRAIDKLNGFVLLGYRIGVKMSSYGGGRKIWRRRSISYKDHAGSEKNRYVWEKGDTSGTSKDDRIANSDVSKKNGIQTRVVKGFVEEELLWKLQRCLVGESASVCDSRNMAERLTKFGLGEVSVKRIQGRYFLIEVPDEEFMEIEMLISINQPQHIDDLIMLEVGDCKFLIRIKERGLSERKSVKSKDVWSHLKEEGSESPGAESTTRSELKISSEVRRNDVGGDMGGEFNVISLENGAIEKDGVGSAAVDVMSEENFFGNNIIIEEENLGSGRESNRAKEDLINMGLIMQVGPSEDGGHQEVLDQSAEMGEEVRFSIVEDFSPFNQYRSKKKSLNKRIRLMREIRDSVLSTKEKQRMDRKERIEKGKAITRGEDPTETEMEMISKEEVRKLWGDDSCEFRFIAAIGKSGGLLTMWSIDDFLVSNVWCDDRVLIIEGKWVKEDLEAVLVNIYAPNIVTE
ncbi:hypothetical protein GOBAR_AA37502 [Gossypium barbadense]|uniref:RRM domain-containing protein n=1 Tax=Gossypium barbadense TaxID=3634 RepID=A0A2P5VWI9_GOSBA|nr:hypothetical protein GOBAR_AA37502 [Gossypium barbadense]